MESEAESELTIARELISLAQQQGVDLASIYNSGTFFHDARIIWFWRKNDVIRYSLQGEVNVLPEKMKASAGLFHGIWGETGSFETIEQAFVLLKAWLLDRKEIDELPCRSVRSYGI